MESTESFFNKMIGDIQPIDHGNNNIYYRVGCVKMSAPRHERWEWVLNFGLGDIDKIFEGTESLNVPVLTFVFPERFMSVHEQQGFISCLEAHPQARGIEQVDILTSSPLIISSFRREQIRIVTFDDDHKHKGRTAWPE